MVGVEGDALDAAVLTVLGGIAVALISGGVSFGATRVNARSTRVTAEAEVQRALNDGFEKLVSGLRGQLDVTSHELETTRGELHDARMEMIDLRGWVRDLIQHVESLEIMLRKAGIDVPPPRTRPHPLTLIEGTAALKP